MVCFVHHLFQELHGTSVVADETQGYFLLHLDIHIAVVGFRTDDLTKPRHLGIFFPIERLDRYIERKCGQLVQVVLQLGVPSFVALELR